MYTQCIYLYIPLANIPHLTTAILIFPHSPPVVFLSKYKEVLNRSRTYFKNFIFKTKCIYQKIVLYKILFIAKQQRSVQVCTSSYLSYRFIKTKVKYLHISKIVFLKTLWLPVQYYTYILHISTIPFLFRFSTMHFGTILLQYNILCIMKLIYY